MSLIFLQISYQKNYNLLFNPVKVIIGHIILLVSKEFFFLHLYFNLEIKKKKERNHSLYLYP